MYAGVVLGGATAVTTTVALTVLPNTGSNMIVNIASAVAVGLVAWGAMYAHSR